MIFKKICILFALAILSCDGKIHIIFSAALTDAYFEFRKQQYIESFEILAKYGYSNVYVIEALKKSGPTFLEDYSHNVFYSTVNNSALNNKGINEATTLLEGIYFFKFAPDDMLLKVTGRHHFLSDYFIKTVENNLNYDAIVKVNEYGAFTVAFAMRCKYLQEMFSQMNFPIMEMHLINLETEVKRYIKKKENQWNFKVLYLDRLDIKAVTLGSSTAPGASGELII